MDHHIFGVSKTPREKRTENSEINFNAHKPSDVDLEKINGGAFGAPATCSVCEKTWDAWVKETQWLRQ